MSTISTQLNWGASYLTNDLYKRFIRKSKAGESEKDVQKDYVLKARLFTLLIVLISLIATTQITTIDSAATFLIECGAGLGMVLILRWYWWRINAWSEIVASLAPFIGYIISNYLLELPYPNNFLFTVVFSTICWLLITFLSKPTNQETLSNFYSVVRPDGWWKPFNQKENNKSNLLGLSLCWISSVIMIYSTLFLIGDLIFLNFQDALVEAIIVLSTYLILRSQMKKTRIFEI